MKAAGGGYFSALKLFSSRLFDAFLCTGRQAFLCTLLILVIFSRVTAEAQETTEDPAAADTAQNDEDGEALRTDSLALDIETADKDQLIAWNLVLGFGDEGSESALRERLKAHYGISGGAGIARASGKGARIEIESAARSEYLKVDIGGSGDESVVRLSGNVVVSVEDEQRGRVHRVEADSVIFNQDQKTISAVGDIKYTVDTAGRIENFSGDSLVFEVSDWTGVIFRGTSQRTQNVGDQDVDFFFRGESINRAGRDILILENGTISSHDTENPDYSLKAKKIWITGPGEWGLLSATLYVGHVPMLYLPFYWKPGSDLFFNPVIGVRTRSGYYIQTTTYLLGRKEKDDGFAILGFGDTASDNYTLESEGLFLVRKPAGEGDKTNQQNTLKFMLDGYTNLGAMTGFLGDFPQIGKNGSLAFYATVGVSRSVDANGSPYFKDGLNVSDYWNSSYIGSASVPIRWGVRLDSSVANWTFYADWYSDPFYFEDFGNRNENFDWLTFLLSEEETDTNTSSNLVSDMKWEIRGSESFSFQKTSPWLQSLSFNTIRTALIWRNKPNGDIDGSGNPDEFVDPARNFFYPDQFIFPDLSFSLRGAAPPLSIDRLTPIELDLAAPKPETGSSADEEGEGPEDEEILASLDSVYSTGLLDASLSYDLTGSLYIESTSDSTNWDAPSDIDFVFQPGRITTTGRNNFSYGLDFWDGFTGISGTTALSAFYQTHQDIFNSGVGVGDTTRLEDYKYTQFLWDNTISAYIKPLQGVPSLSATTVSYTFDGNIYGYQFDENATVNSPEYVGNWIAGEEDVRRHEAEGKFVWGIGPFTASAGSIVNIPPMSERYSFNAGLNFAHQGWKAGVSQQTTYTADTWTFQPLSMNASWTGWKDEVTVSQTALYDPGPARWSSTESVLEFWGFETRFTANYGNLYYWDVGNSIWLENGEGFAPASLRFSYNRSFKPLPMWKNRITLTTTLDTSWNINLRQFTDNVLTFSWIQDFAIYKFLDLRFTFRASNKSMYLYFDGWRSQLGISQQYNFFEDLAKSFNFGNIQDRYDSQFNMDSISLEVIHHLRNWDLSVSYSGWPALNTAGTSYIWKSEFSLFVKWNPLPMFNQRTTFENDVWAVDSFEMDN